MSEIKINESWKEPLHDVFADNKFQEIRNTVRGEYQNKLIFPAPKDIFAAFDMVPFENVQVVILGQDPYHGPGQAMGLSFSVPDGVTPPPSLLNIYKELESDLGIVKNKQSGDLRIWARQGVLLLNSILTVRAHQAASHRNIGWEWFTDSVLRILSEGRENIVFMLWGNFARGKKGLIDTGKHLVLEASHPSPLSAGSGFFGCKHFSQCNEYLEQHGKEIVQW